MHFGLVLLTGESPGTSKTYRIIDLSTRRLRQSWLNLEKPSGRTLAIFPQAFGEDIPCSVQSLYSGESRDLGEFIRDERIPPREVTVFRVFRSPRTIGGCL